MQIGLWYAQSMPKTTPNTSSQIRTEGYNLYE